MNRKQSLTIQKIGLTISWVAALYFFNLGSPVAGSVSYLVGVALYEAIYRSPATGIMVLLGLYLLAMAFEEIILGLVIAIIATGVAAFDLFILIKLLREKDKAGKWYSLIIKRLPDELIREFRERELLYRLPRRFVDRSKNPKG